MSAREAAAHDLSSSVVSSSTSSEPDKQGLRFERHFTTAGVDPLDLVEWELRDALISDASGKAFFEARGVEFPKGWSQSAVNVVTQKYFRIVNGVRETSVRQMVTRVADTIYAWGVKGRYFATPEYAKLFRDELVHLLLNQKMAFNSPVWFNVGAMESPQTSACFINRVEDTMDSILDLAKTEGMLFKLGSGAGSNLSNIRSSTEALTNGGIASGPVSFMKGYDAFAGAIKSGGSTRRAAKLTCLNVDHPDIVEFIDCKAIEEKKAWALIDAGYDGNFNVPGGAYDSIDYQNANHSVRVSDAFMTAAVTDGDWQTKAVTDGKVVKTVKARELLRKMAEAAWVCGDPGMQYDTTINDWHTSPLTDRINASNPCCIIGETLVYTSRGMIPIAVLADEAFLGGQLPEAFGFDWLRKEPSMKPIKKVWVAGWTKNLVEVCTTGGLVLRTTPDHRFYWHDGEAVEAQKLKPGNRLQAGSVHDEVKSVTPVLLESAVPVYDMEVEDIHTFAVSSDASKHCVVISNSEYMFLDDSACNLASLNLRKFQHETGIFSPSDFIAAVEVTITAMEILIDNSSYPTAKIAENSHKHRPLGLGYANLGALLMSNGLPYDSKEGRIYAALITALMGGAAYRQSALIARDATGPSEGFKPNRAPFLRTLGVFRKLGFVDVSGAPAFDQAMFVDFDYAHRGIGGKAWVPDVSGSLDLRYNFWNYLKLEITCLREFTAIAYYWANDWI